MAHPDHQRDRARVMRRDGASYREIVKALGGKVPRSTVQRWTKGIEPVEPAPARPDPSGGGRFPELANLVGRLNDDQLVGLLLGCVAEAYNRGINPEDYACDR